MPAFPGKLTLPLAESAGSLLAAPTCSLSKQNFLHLLCWKNPVPYATPWPAPAEAWSSAGSSPDTPEPQPGLSQHADSCAAGTRRWRWRGRELELPARDQELVGTPLPTLRNSNSQLCNHTSRSPPVPSAARTRLPRLLQRVSEWGLPRVAVSLSTQITYSHSGVSAGTAAPRGASCAGPGARPGRAPRGFPRWPGSPAARPTGALVSGLSLTSPGCPEMGDRLPRCSLASARCGCRALTLEQK